ncbi:MAG: hypothetical protein HFJ41_06450 [Clostridia bacterium]|nr:hypothetical protein [Clostridia bacterium]
MRKAKVYENNLYNCDIRNAENLERIYDARREWKDGKYNYNKLLNKDEIYSLLDNNLVAIEGLEEVTEEDLKKLDWLNKAE